MHFIFFLGELEVLNYFILQMAKGVERAGADCYLVDLSRPETYRSEAFIRYLNQEHCVLFLMNQFSPMPAWEKLGIPIFNFCQDHPRSMRSILEHAPAHMHVIVLDRNHESYIRQLFPAVNHIHFLPNGGEQDVTVRPYEERDIDVLYCGNCQPQIMSVPAFSFLKEGGEPFYRTCRQYLIEDPSRTIEEAITRYFEEGNEPAPSPELFRQLLMEGAFPIEELVRRHFKLTFMKALDDAGIAVEIYGTGWETAEMPFSERIRIHPRVSSAECNHLIGNARINLNFLPWLRDGSSERVFNAMLNGALCVTDTNRYLAARFTDKKELVFFDLRNTDSLVSNILYYLNHPAEAKIIALKGMAVTSENDTWTHRFRKIVQIAEAI